METKRQNAITATLDGNTLELQFANGDTLSLHIAALNTDIQQYAMMHGLKQKLVDAAAISRNPETGRAATIDDKYQAVKAVYDRLLAGQWNAAREGGGGSGGLLFKALCRMYETKTPAQIKAYLESKTDAEKTALRKNPKVADLIDIIRNESGKPSSFDTYAMLGELDD